MLIICKGSGHDARKRVVRLQKEMINEVSKYKGNTEKTNKLIEDFQRMSEDSKIFNEETDKSLEHIASFEHKDFKKEKQNDNVDV